MKKLIIYHSHIPKVGGIETAVFNLASLLSDHYDITILFRTNESSDTLWKYSKYANVVRFDSLEEYVCDFCLIASNHEVPRQMRAKRIVQWIHSDYRKYNLKLLNIGDIDEYISVSKYCADVIEEMCGVESRVIPNLLSPDFGKKKRKKPLRLVTASRISPEKGFDRMLIMAKALKDAKVDFIWYVLGDNTQNSGAFNKITKSFSPVEEVSFVGYKSDVSPFLREADYLVQLSDWEGCPYSVLEALKMKKPCIVSEWGGVGEVVKEGNNGIILKMDMSNLDIKKIMKKDLKMTFKPKGGVEDWIKLLENK